ncbi:putative F-box protein pp2-b12 [Phtheirospermum japonicum]|uniref:Putative F-box protein pp2-b12 n=1 Tax=Phtheirospermum japonicum TaxID=374723 RepID=A0A830BXM3_9LAMI|nr:putative F-box protein pp2-b12 [Phtheirospermum japonicum]
MSNNYDNWERLVRVVLRRESDRQLALTHSRDFSNISSTSISTLDLSFMSTAEFEDDDFEIGMCKNYNDDDGRERLRFFLDERTGKKCFLLGAINFQDSSGAIPGHFKSNTKSRFSGVLELYDLEDLDIRCSINLQSMLSPNTLYAAYLVFDNIKKYEVIEATFAAHSSMRVFHNGSDYRSKAQDRTVYFESENGRLDGWTEVELGDFYVYPEEDKEVQVRLMCYDDSMMKIGLERLVIEGIEFRPLESKQNIKAGSKFDQFMSIFSRQTSQLSPMGYSYLKQRFYHDVRTAKNCVRLRAMDLLISWGDNPSSWKWTTHVDSRFPEVAELISVWWLNIRVGIKTRMLSPKTDYAAFLVFKLAEGSRGLEQVNGMIRFLDESENVAQKRARILNLLIAVTSRADGWMEIEVGNFHVEKGDEREVEAQLFETRCNLKNGLIVECIEFRPMSYTV